MGQNPPGGAVVYFSLKAEPKAETKIEILEPSNDVIRTYSSQRFEELNEPPNPEDKKPEKQIKPEVGLNRFVWDGRLEEAVRVPDYYLYEYQRGAAGPMALPGKYQVRLTVDGQSQTAPFDWKLDPRSSVSDEDLKKQFELGMQIREELNKVFAAANQVVDVQSQVRGIRRRVADSPSTKPLLTSANSVDQKLIAVRDELIQVKVRANEDSLSYPPAIDSKLAVLAVNVGAGTDSAPTESEYQVFEKLKKQAEESLAHWTELQKNDLAAFQKLAAEQNVQAIIVPAPTHFSNDVGGKEPR